MKTKETTQQQLNDFKSLATGEMYVFMCVSGLV